MAVSVVPMPSRCGLDRSTFTNRAVSTVNGLYHDCAHAAREAMGLRIFRRRAGQDLGRCCGGYARGHIPPRVTSHSVGDDGHA